MQKKLLRYSNSFLCEYILDSIHHYLSGKVYTRSDFFLGGFISHFPATKFWFSDTSKVCYFWWFISFLNLFLPHLCLIPSWSKSKTSHSWGVFDWWICHPFPCIRNLLVQKVRKCSSFSLTRYLKSHIPMTITWISPSSCQSTATIL